MQFLPPRIVQFQTLSLFRRHLKTHYSVSLPCVPPSAHPQCALILFQRLWCYINHLLTYLVNRLLYRNIVLTTAARPVTAIALVYCQTLRPRGSFV